ncbi:MAG: site-specific integrase, partial [Alkalispirochaeta sp.]
MSTGVLADDVQRYLDYQRSVRGMADTSIRAYHADLRGFLEFAREARISSPHAIDAKLLRRWVRNMGDRGLAASSVNRRISAIRGFLGFLVGEGTIPGNPADVLRSVKTPKRLPETLFESEIDTLLQVEGDDFTAARTRFLLEALYSTGARISELCNANVDDLVPRRR